MKFNTSRSVALSLLLTVSMAANSQSKPSSIFTEALTLGEGSTSLPDDATFGRLLAALKEKTGNSGVVLIKTKLVKKFQQQPTCGRVVFVITQPASNTAWDDLGGQLNICEDGLPPLRTCAATQALYPSTAKCPDGTSPVDTEEVALATKTALASGGLTHEQAKAVLSKRLQEQSKAWGQQK